MKNINKSVPSSDTPRTKQRREIAEKRLQYFKTGEHSVQMPPVKPWKQPPERKEFQHANTINRPNESNNVITSSHFMPDANNCHLKSSIPSPVQTVKTNLGCSDYSSDTVIKTPRKKTSEFKFSMTSSSAEIPCDKNLSLGDNGATVDHSALEDISEIGLSTHRPDISTFRSDGSDGILPFQNTQFSMDVEKHISLAVRDKLDLSYEMGCQTPMLSERNTALENVLGKERMERLLKNLQESDDSGSFEDFSAQTNGNGVQFFPRVKSPSSEADFGKSWLPVKSSWMDDDSELRLETHRPEANQPYHSSNSQVSNDRPYHMSSEDIYAEADQVTLTDLDINDNHLKTSKVMSNGPESEVSSLPASRQVMFLPRKAPFGPIPKPWEVEDTHVTSSLEQNVHSSVHRKKGSEPEFSSKNFTNPSIERYFSSLEKVGRSDKDRQAVHHNSSLIPEPSFSTAIKIIDENSFKAATTFTHDPNKSDFENYLEKVHDDIRLSLQDDDDNDDVYTRVTYALSEVNEENVNDKLRKLGIDFDFVKSIKSFDEFKADLNEVDKRVLSRELHVGNGEDKDHSCLEVNEDIQKTPAFRTSPRMGLVCNSKQVSDETESSDKPLNPDTKHPSAILHHEYNLQVLESKLSNSDLPLIRTGMIKRLSLNGSKSTQISVNECDTSHCQENCEIKTAHSHPSFLLLRKSNESDDETLLHSSRTDFELYMDSVRTDLRKSLETEGKSHLYDRVASVLSDVNESNVNKRLRRLGIEYDFLKGIQTFEDYKTEAGEVSDCTKEEKSSSSTHAKSDTEGARSSKQPIQQPLLSGFSPRQEESKSKPSKGVGASIVRICPDCAEVNTFSANWCVECEASLACVKPVSSKIKSHKTTKSVKLRKSLKNENTSSLDFNQPSFKTSTCGEWRLPSSATDIRPVPACDYGDRLNNEAENCEEDQPHRNQSINYRKKTEFENYIESVRSDIRESLEVNDKDDLYTRVTSALSEVDESNINERLKNLGIDFDFLKSIKTFDKFKAELNEVKDKGYVGNGFHDEKRKLSSSSHPGKNCVPKPSSSSDSPRNNGMTTKPPNGVGASIVRVCPECAEVNSFSANFCSECETSLVCVKPVPSKIKSRSARKSLNSSVSSSIYDATNCSSDNGQQNNTAGSSNFNGHRSSFPSSELSLNLRDSADSSIPSPDQKHDGREVLDLRSVDDITFEYQADGDSRPSLPEAMRMELSLNLRDSMDSVATNSGYSLVGPSKNERADTSNGLDAGSASEQQAAGNQSVGTSPVQVDFKQFIDCFADDPRFKNDNNPLVPHGSNGVPKPSQSKGPPSSKKGSRSHQSKVKSSLEVKSYPRRWATSSTSWSSFAPGDLSKPSSIQAHVSGKRPRPSSASMYRPASGAVSQSMKGSRPTSAQTKRPDAATHSLRQRPYSAGSCRTDTDSQQSGSQSQDDLQMSQGDNDGSNSTKMTNSKHNGHRGRILRVSQSGSSNDKLPEPPAVNLPQRQAGSASKALVHANNYHAKFFAMRNKLSAALTEVDPEMTDQKIQCRTLPPIPDMSPRIRLGEVSMMTCLPDEILLLIFGYLGARDLSRCALVSHALHRVAMDSSLWKSIVVKKRMVKDDWLIHIGAKQPGSLSLIQCRGDDVTANGLRELFRQCGDTLQELNITGCSRGQLTGDTLLLHAGSRCRYITALDVSWCNVCDNSLLGFSDSCHRLESLCLNGGQMVSDDALEAMFRKHGHHLRTLEIFGCFHITSKAISAMAEHCTALVNVNLGQCWKLSDTCLSQLSARLTSVQTLDLRGCKQIKDSTTHQILRNCPRLHTLALANCPSITDSSLAEIAVLGQNIRSLDVCGCKKVTDVGVKSLARGCKQLEFLDISSTCITHQSVSALAGYCNRYLEVLKVNFCKSLSPGCLLKLAKHCKRLRKLYLYGVNGIRDHNVHDMKVLNDNLWIEM